MPRRSGLGVAGAKVHLAKMSILRRIPSMIAKTLKLGTKSDRETKATYEMVEKQWRSRISKYQQQLTHSSAEYLHKTVLDKAPRGDGFQEYRSSLKVRPIKGLKTGLTGFAVAGIPKAKKLSTLSEDSVLIYVKPTRVKGRRSPALAYLVENSPWTLNTLPFTPSKKDAVLVKRKVSAKEVESVERKRRKAKTSTKNALRNSGKMRRFGAATNKFKFKKGQAMTDLAYTGLRSEFGVNAEKPKPHWRPAVRSLRQEGLRNMGKNRNFARPLFDPFNQEWKSWPRVKTKAAVPVKVAGQLGQFQKRLGIKWK